MGASGYLLWTALTLPAFNSPAALELRTWSSPQFVAIGSILSQSKHFRVADRSPCAETSRMGLPHFGHRSRCVSKKPPQNPTVAVSWSNDNGNKWLNPLTRGKAGIAVCKGLLHSFTHLRTGC